MIVGVFFHARSARPGLADAVDEHLAREQLLPASGHGVSVEAQEIRDPAFRIATQLEGFDARKEAAQALVQQRREQHNRGLHLLCHLVGRDTKCDQPASLRGPGSELPSANRGIRCAVQVRV